ncbi:50S ribosomal protein L19 [Candidatus Roizmanbacteria bacterium RIFCSPHIGHO2_02_FULL_37_13b]|uniref:50S ribosomal protein L19 n=1 Tax=Candidatus Roizmanbacteria bacterium RIFCSPLOWO2_02_FULL_36_11 TaxID=1802071 RepID=A0A1F7JI09_9BACT|nr:MAG: 50S ribosomal protein L19 [Candidatus Roizmanbacteria bacterium RIFCSPHIGHO2_02_FULL_37_13b]OGK55231.1 MAG: 50S ribosomal protein L19 [Candidatus Roizmanbacteria bacterium RIFCSPLOWO2_02_FULL_36_11]
MANNIIVKDVECKIGDTIKVHYSFKEGDKFKKQIFQGILIAIKGKGNNRMITVRKLSHDNLGVERIYPIISPNIEKISIDKHANVRRSKLYYIRQLSESEIRDRVLS